MGSPINVNKRQFLLRHVPVALSLTALPSLATAKSGRSLYLHNLHTQERLECWYYSNGKYLPQALDRINHLFRDHRTEQAHQIDENLLDTLFQLRLQFGIEQPIEIISGYRSAKTNEMLRRHSNGVARKSYHMVGRAVDCRFPGVPTSVLRDEAIAAARGGVGYYRRSDFVHLDTGPVRNW